jgi:hypothetical protein
MMTAKPLLARIYHPSCGRSYYYALVRKRFKREVTDENGNKTVLLIRTFMCRNCAEEFTELDIMEHEAQKPQVSLSEMTEEQRMDFIRSLYPRKEPDGRPS